MSIRNRLFHMAIGLDQFVWVMITLGWGFPDETISSASYRYELKGHRWAKIVRPILDWLFLPFEEDHCYLSYMSEVNRNHIFK